MHPITLLFSPTGCIRQQTLQLQQFRGIHAVTDSNVATSMFRSITPMSNQKLHLSMSSSMQRLMPLPESAHCWSTPADLALADRFWPSLPTTFIHKRFSVPLTSSVGTHVEPVSQSQQLIAPMITTTSLLRAISLPTPLKSAPTASLLQRNLRKIVSIRAATYSRTQVPTMSLAIWT
ncbi:unannotated protein [freshwater metagenome]|uniref:Unannotated protein n=1 Tax=freshwater metagenome TaxID=449393 RepID=A0A6J6YQJ7_9ZZZZ